METTEKAAETKETITPVVGSGVDSAPLQKPLAQSGAKSVNRKSHAHPDDNLRMTVATMSLAGFPIPKICAALKISAETLQEHYKFELENGRTNLMTQVVQSLAQRAIGGSDTAAIFLAKARLGWSDRQQVELTGANGGPIEIQQKTEIVTRLAGELARGITIDHDAE